MMPAVAPAISRRFLLVSVLVALLGANLWIVVSRWPASEPQRRARYTPRGALHHFETLAGRATGAVDDLSRALEIVERFGDAWRAQEIAAGKALADYREGAEAVEALGRWVQDRGPMPPRHREIAMLRLGRLAIATASAEATDGLATGIALGRRMVVEGRSLLEASVGAALLRQGADRTRALGLPPSRDWAPPPDALRRILAAEAATSMRLLIDPSDDPWVLAEAAGEYDAAEVQAFWERILDGGDPATDTEADLLERVRRFGRPAKRFVPLSHFVEPLAEQLAELRRTPWPR